ncbi:hypothetical protein LXL04_006974 [Taraxacum kok-saghyz]
MGSREVVDDDDGNGEAASSGQRRLRREQGRSSAGDKGFAMGFLDGEETANGIASCSKSFVAMGKETANSRQDVVDGGRRWLER